MSKHNERLIGRHHDHVLKVSRVSRFVEALLVAHSATQYIREGFIYYSSYFWWNFPRRGAGGTANPPEIV